MSGTHVAADNLVVLGILDNLLNFLDSAINVFADTANHNDVISRSIASIGAELNGQRLVFTDDPVLQKGNQHQGQSQDANKFHSRIEGSSIFSDNSFVPLLLNRDRLSLDIGSILCHLQELLLDIFETFSFVDGGKRSRGRVWVIDEENRRLFSRLRREKDRDIVNIMEGLDPKGFEIRTL